MPTAAGVFPDKIRNQVDFSGSLSDGYFLRYVLSGDSFTLVQVTASLIGLGSVENTALSTWAGSTNLTALGTIVTGVWHGTIIAGTYGGTGVNNGAKTLTYLKNISLTAADDTGVYTLPTGTKTLLATDGAGTGLSGIPYTLTGTSNQVVLSAGTGNITFSLPQSIHTAGTPTFASLTLTAATALTLGTASSIAGAIVLKNATNSNTLTIRSGVTGTTITYTLPTADLTNGYLKSDGSGVMSWATVSAGDVYTNQANTFTIAPQTITIDDASHIGIVINAAASQSAPALRLKDSSGNTCVDITAPAFASLNGMRYYNNANAARWAKGCATGSLGSSVNNDFIVYELQAGFACLQIQSFTGKQILSSYDGTSGYLGQVTISTPYQTTTKILVLRGLAAHTGNYVEMQASDATVINKTDASGHVSLQYGTSATLAGVGGVVANRSTTVNTTSTDGTENDLDSFTTPANTFAADNDSLLQMEHIVTVGSATAARRIKRYFAGTLIWDSGALTLALGTDFFITTLIIRESSTVVRCVVSVTTTSASTVPYTTYTRITGLTLSGTNILKSAAIASGTGAASGDVLEKISKTKWFPAAP